MPIAVLLLVAVACFAQQPRAPGNETIARDQLKADLFFLAGEGMRGRLTGTAEYQLSAEWIESRFARLGLKPAGGGESFYHRYDLVRSRLGAGNQLSVTARGITRQGRLREDFYPLIFSGSSQVEAGVVFAGYGIRAPKLGWEDYQPADVRGRIVLMLDGEPQAADPKSRFDGVVTSEHSGALRKTLGAIENGAAGVLLFSLGRRGRNEFSAGARANWPEKPPHLERYTLASYAGKIHIPVAQIAPELAELLVESSGKKLEDLRAEAEKGPWARPVATDARIKLRLSVERQIVEDRSVVAMMEGADPELKKEAVILSAHYDHNGATAEQVFHGADDNGSGTVALLEIAEAYALAAERGQRPRRSVLFASWGSEERCCGPLLGAWAWVENPAWPLSGTAAVLNMDMIGRSEEVPEGGGAKFNGLAVQTAASNANNVNLLGYSYSPDLSAAVDEANRAIDLRILRRYDNNRSNLLRRSDQWPFLQRGVPALFFHTGLHPDYHTMYDRPEKIDYAKLERIARLVHQTSWDLANRKTRPKLLDPRPIPEKQ
jgi:hypothetical protein